MLPLCKVTIDLVDQALKVKDDRVRFLDIPLEPQSLQRRGCYRWKPTHVIYDFLDFPWGLT